MRALKSINFPITFLSLPTAVFCLLTFVFSIWLMWHTFAYDPAAKELLIGSRVWSDFASHIPLVRSFTFGHIWPVQDPVFPGVQIRYHFLFYLVVGLLERLGVRIDWAMNVPSIIGFCGMLWMIYFLALKLFGNRGAAVLSVILFLFNGSFTFLDYFKKFGYSLKALSRIVTNTEFVSFGPWNGSDISAFWNLNIYTNQRHLAFAFALVLAIIYLALNKINAKVSPLIGFLLGILLFLNQAAFAIGCIFLLFQFLSDRKARLPLILSGLFFLPFYVVSTAIIDSVPSIALKPGFLMDGKISAWSFFLYWLQNMGMSFFLIPIGFLVSPKNTRVLTLPLLVLFVLPNLIRLSPDMINNHKLFNFYLLLGNMFTANLLIWLWEKRVGKVLVPIALFLATFSGVIDIFPIINDRYLRLQDYVVDERAQYILDTTKPTDIFLTGTTLYHPASLVGRPIFCGYPYFTWSHGYNADARRDEVFAIFRAKTKEEACRLLELYNIDYVELSRYRDEWLQPNDILWDQKFLPISVFEGKEFRLFGVEENCGVSQGSEERGVSI